MKKYTWVGFTWSCIA